MNLDRAHGTMTVNLRSLALLAGVLLPGGPDNTGPGCAPDPVMPDLEKPHAPGGASRVALHVSGTPLLLAYRDGNRPWSSLPLGAREHSLAVENAYRVAIVCTYD